MAERRIRLDADEVRTALRKLRPALTALRNLSSESNDLYCAQVSAKWGDETGPQEFRAKYQQGLWGFHKEFSLLHGRVEAFVKGVEDAINLFGEVDADAAALQTINEAKLNRQRLEATPRRTNPGLI